MIDDAKLQKVILGPDWIDLSFGEPKTVMDALFRQLNHTGNKLKMPKLNDLTKWEYQPAAGKPDLVKILEKKYDAKVVVCNGAKQALTAAMYAVKQQGCEYLAYSKPYYPANPSLTQLTGLIPVMFDDVTKEFCEASNVAKLITTPNNPDGSITPTIDIIRWSYSSNTIHDAAYYTDIYLPSGDIPLPVGQIQVFSMSKMYGLSGLRIGYAVCHSEKYYQDMVNYMELTTAGVSTASQDIARNIEVFFRDNPSHYKEFCNEARASIALARKELEKLDPEVLELMPCQSNSMFGWFKRGPRLNNKAAKVHILDGSLFGAPGMMRMNIAHPPEIIRDAVARLNKHKIRS